MTGPVAKRDKNTTRQRRFIGYLPRWRSVLRVQPCCHFARQSDKLSRLARRGNALTTDVNGGREPCLRRDVRCCWILQQIGAVKAGPEFVAHGRALAFARSILIARKA